jgi:hypothetical protein
MDYFFVTGLSGQFPDVIAHVNELPREPLHVAQAGAVGYNSF